MADNGLVIVALSGGVDSAVTALLLRDAGYDVQCLHMSNWEDDGYCEASRDFQDARKIAQQMDLPLHRVNFTDEYREQVFAHFLAEYEAGRTPNPDVLCNRQIKFGEMRRYAHRLGADALATGHYARLKWIDDRVHLLKGHDASKDQSYFLHAVNDADFADVLFPLGGMRKREVRSRARHADLAVADKKDSTGICFIGERPFAEFLGQYLPENPGQIKEPGGRVLGEHQGLAYYTLGQRHGLNIGGLAAYGPEPWYVAEKDHAHNELIVVQGTGHPLLYQNWLTAEAVHWINGAPADWSDGATLECRAKTRYRQPDQACTVTYQSEGALEVWFEQPQRAVTPGQYVVFYQADRCLGGATIQAARMKATALKAAPARRAS
ncbi:MAG: tRNA 2-thiouridine(34) synthase MnmA [Gammaproteobacteria bacterium]|jgi:tRNA-specific 2-thiouridylase